MKISTPKERLREVMADMKLKQVDLLEMSKKYQEELGIKLSKGSISQYISGQSNPDNKKIKLLAKTLGVEEPWLLGYDVPMERQKLDITMFETVKKLADQRKMSLNQVEEQLDFPKNTLYKWKNQLPNSDKLKKIADFFNVSTDHLLGRDATNNNQVMYRLNTDNLNGEEVEQLISEMKHFEEMVLAKLKMDRKDN